ATVAPADQAARAAVPSGGLPLLTREKVGLRLRSGAVSGHNSHVKKASLSEVKNDLSRYVDHVRRGGRVRILVRGVPAADLVPGSRGGEGDAAEDPRLGDLERRGLIRRGDADVAPEILRPGPRLGKKSLAEALIDERREGR